MEHGAVLKGTRRRVRGFADLLVSSRIHETPGRWQDAIVLERTEKKIRLMRFLSFAASSEAKP
jgi:hypothetical protein